MECPRCALINPDTALRCDCGFDFTSKTVEKAYFTQELPADIRGYFRALVVLNAIVALAAFAQRDIAAIARVAIWSALVHWLYSELLQRKNWARIALVVVTFPVGLFLGLSREARLYCMQRDQGAESDILDLTGKR